MIIFMYVCACHICWTLNSLKVRVLTHSPLIFILGKNRHEVKVKLNCIESNQNEFTVDKDHPVSLALTHPPHKEWSKSLMDVHMLFCNKKEQSSDSEHEIAAAGL